MEADMLRRLSVMLGVFCVCVYLYACGGTEVIKNPQPIVWGNITFAPETIEKSSDKTVWNNVAITGYNQKGVIQKVTIKGDEVIIENINSDFYKANSLKLAKVSGDYQKALAFIMSGDYERSVEQGNFGNSPDVQIGSYSGQNEEFATNQGVVSIGKTNYSDMSFQGVGKGESENIVMHASDGSELKIEKASCGKVFVPKDFAENPEGLILDSIRVMGISAPDVNASIKSVSLDYANKKFSGAVNGIKVPSASLEELNIQNFPEFLEGDLQGEGSITGKIISLDASLELKKLLDATCDLTGNIDNSLPDSLNFTLRDTGILSLLTQEQKAQLGFLAIFVPDGAEILGQFLSRPGQTLQGKITFNDLGVPRFNFSVQQ